MTVSAEAIDGEFFPRHHPEVTTVDLDDEAVLYDERTGMAHVLNGTAAVVWSYFDGAVSMRELITGLAAAYGVPAEDIEGDVMSLVRHLGSQGLLEGVAADGPAPDGPGPATHEEDACVDD